MIVGKGLQVVEGTPRPLWMPVAVDGASGANTVYIGQAVTQYTGSNDGVIGIAASGAAPATVLPWGVVLGSSNLTPLYDGTTTFDEYATGVYSQALQKARDWRMQEGMWIKSDPALMVQIATITDESVRAPILMLR